MRPRFAAPAMLTLWFFCACGGRYTNSDGDGFGGSGGASQGGRLSMSGASGVPVAAAGGVATGRGGSASTGGKTTGGAVGVAGTPNTGGGCDCKPFLCAPGEMAVPNADGCCFHCETVRCAEQPCPDLGCAPGFHLETPPEACCPICVSDEKCRAQQADYRSFREELLTKYSSLGCRVDADCTLYWDKNACAAGCEMYVPVSAVPSLDQNLRSFAAMTCSPSCPIEVPPCDAPGRPLCDVGTGRCTAVWQP